jgi:radical SAM protein with 4Fe4S-binding SPASM domain
MDHLAEAGFGPFKISIVVTRHNVDQLDGFKALADSYGAQLRVTRLRPSGRGVDSWPELHPTNEQQRQIYRWLLAQGDGVLTGDSFFHLNALGEPLPGLNMCGAGRVVCLIDPIGDVYACPFVIHDEFLAGNVRDPGGFTAVWRASSSARCASPSRPAPAELQRYDACQGGCMAASSSPGSPRRPRPECVHDRARDELELVRAGAGAAVPRPAATTEARRVPPQARHRRPLTLRPAAGRAQSSLADRGHAIRPAGSDPARCLGRQPPPAAAERARHRGLARIRPAGATIPALPTPQVGAPEQWDPGGRGRRWGGGTPRTEAAGRSARRAVVVLAACGSDAGTVTQQPDLSGMHLTVGSTRMDDSMLAGLYAQALESKGDRRAPHLSTRQDYFRSGGRHPRPGARALGPAAGVAHVAGHARPLGRPRSS